MAWQPDLAPHWPPGNLLWGALYCVMATRALAWRPDFGCAPRGKQTSARACVSVSILRLIFRHLTQTSHLGAQTAFQRAQWRRNQNTGGPVNLLLSFKSLNGRPQLGAAQCGARALAGQSESQRQRRRQANQNRGRSASKRPAEMVAQKEQL